ncbi:MAG: mercury resistance system periplasmic binding protein MerP [Thermodesulfovibrionales bacterium]
MKKAVQVQRMILSIFVLAWILFVPAINNVWGSEVAKHVTLKVDGMTCASCPATVKAVLKRLPGVINADVSYKEAKATVSYYEGKVTVEQMIKAIEDAGYTAHLITEGGKQ